MMRDRDTNSLITTLLYGAVILILSVHMLANAISESKYRKEIDAKLDRIASETDAVHSRLDAMNEKIDRHSAENGEIVQSIILNINEIKTNMEEEIKRIDKDIKRVEESKKEKKEQQAQAVAYTAPAAESSGYDHPFRSQGTTNDGNYDYTWYSQRALPGEGLSIPGRHVNEDGFVCDGDGRICVAIDGMDYGTEVDTPFGKAVVYDHVSPDGSRTGLIDVYTDW